MQLDRTQTITTLAAIGLLFAGIVTVDSFVDPDMFHEMALIRQAVEVGALPLQDDFAYTPTVSPIIQHEWGTGAVLYCLTQFAGPIGILTLKYVLAAGIALGVMICARKRGAAAAVLGPLLPTVIFLGKIGITTVRAQMFTLGGLVCLLCFLEADRAGRHRRQWIAPWLVLFVLWLNLHGGFVVGLAVLGGYGNNYGYGYGYNYFEGYGYGDSQNGSGYYTDDETKSSKKSLLKRFFSLF